MYVTSSQPHVAGPVLTKMQAYLANVGQDEDWEEVEKKALALGAEKMVIRDLQKEVCSKLESPSL